MVTWNAALPINATSPPALYLAEVDPPRAVGILDALVLEGELSLWDRSRAAWTLRQLNPDLLTMWAPDATRGGRERVLAAVALAETDRAGAIALLRFLVEPLGQRTSYSSRSLTASTPSSSSPGTTTVWAFPLT